MNEEESGLKSVPRDPNQIVGRTWADLIAHSQTGPKLDAALARATDWTVGGIAVGYQRLQSFWGLVDRKLESAETEPKAIPERVVLEVVQNVAREEREELRELWADLLVSAAQGTNIDAFYIAIVRQLDPPSAKFFRELAVTEYIAVGTNELAASRCAALNLATPGEHPIDRALATLQSQSDPQKRWGSDATGMEDSAESSIVAAFREQTTTYKLTPIGGALAIALGYSRAKAEA